MVKLVPIVTNRNNIMDIWHYPRKNLADFIIKGMSNNLLQRVSIFAPRKRGKTQFIQQDVVPLCRSMGILPIYVDFWMQKDDPEGVFIKSVTAACEKNESLISKIGKLFVIKKLGVGFGGQKIEVESGTQASTVDLFTVFKQLNELDMPVLLLLDEIQHLATRKEFESFTAALRSFVVNREDRNVKCIFTGSSREGLNRLFKDSQAPFYNSSQTLDFDELGVEFVDHELGAFEKATGGVVLDRDKALEVLITQNRAPARFVEMLQNMVLNTVHNLDEGVKRFDKERSESDGGFCAIYDGLNPIDAAILKLIAVNEANKLYTAAGEAKVSAFVANDSVQVTMWGIKNAVKRLKNKGLVFSPARGKLEIENHDFKDFILEK